MNQTIIVSAYFGGTSNHRKIKYFERLQAHLDKFQFNFHLVSLGGGDIQTNCKYTRLPESLLQYTKTSQELYSSKVLSQDLALAATMEASYHHVDFSSAAEGILRYADFMQKLLSKEKPSLCVIWHKFNGLHRTLTYLCQNLEIPYVFAHLGVLPGTIIFEQGGEMAESWVAQRNEDFLQLPITEQDMSLTDHYLDFVRTQKKDRKPQASEGKLHPIVQRVRDKKQPLIFYAGQNDYHTGTWPCWLPEARTHSPFFVHTLDALQYLARLAEKNNWQILFKPHPNIDQEQMDFQEFSSDHVNFVTGSNVFECIQAADLTITITSTVSYLALIHNRPVLLLGRNQLSGKGCVYEINSLYEVEQTVQQALEAGLTQNQQEQWHKHVAQVCKYYTFSFDNETVDLIGRDVDDAARYLMLQTQFPHLLYTENSANQLVIRNDKSNRFTLSTILNSSRRYICSFFDGSGM